MLHPYLPDDFQEFWKETLAEAMDRPLDGARHLAKGHEAPGLKLETYEFRGIEGHARHGWISIPDDRETGERLPGFLWVPPYGRESLLPNRYGTRHGYVSTSLNFFGHDAFHQEKYTPERGYFAEGALEPETWRFRRMFQDAVLAFRFLRSLPEVSEDRLGAMGMSQGAGISIWLGAHCPGVRAVCADMPFLGAIKQTLGNNIYRYPLKELKDLMAEAVLGEERVFNTVSYFDTMNQATACHVPTQVSLGLKDPACKPDTVRAIFEALPKQPIHPTPPRGGGQGGGVESSELEHNLLTYDWGHDWHPDMIENNRAWLDRWL